MGQLNVATPISLLRLCLFALQPSYWRPLVLLEKELSDPTLERIEQELKQINVNLAEANDIAMLGVFKAMPPELDNDSRKALSLLRDKMMERARNRAGI